MYNKHYYCYLFCILKSVEITCVLFLLSFTTACSSEQPLISNDGYAISNIHIKVSGAAIVSRPDMIDICKGFLLSKNQVMEFFVNASTVKDSSTGIKFDILPCYMSGNAIINDSAYKWVLRSGGIGELIAKNKKIIKVCGKECCEKVPGVC